MIVQVSGSDVRITRAQEEGFSRRIHRVLARFGPHLEFASLNFERISRNEVRCRLSFSGPRCGVHVINIERPDVGSAMNAVAELIGVEAGRLIGEVRPTPILQRKIRGLDGKNPNRRTTSIASSSNHERRKAG